MRRPWLIALLVVLLVLDARNAIELLFGHRFDMLESRIYGETLNWLSWTVVLCFDLAVLWLTIRIVKRLRNPPSTAV